MSWLARSIVSTLRLDDDDLDDVVDNDSIIQKKPPHQLNDAATAENHNSNLLLPAESVDFEEVDLDDRDENNNNNNNNNKNDNNNLGQDKDINVEDYGDPRNKNNLGRGVTEDLSEFKETLTRQLWGVASFVAPPSAPPPPPPQPPAGRRNFIWLQSDRRRMKVVQESDDEDDEEAEYGTEAQLGKFREMGMQGEGEVQVEEDDVLAGAAGITEEALDFAENTAHHPETWLNFPLSEEEEFDDFEISDSQFKHARAIERLAPRLAALRRELCPAHMTEGYFWMVYFVLLHSRLDKHDDELLSTLQLVKARTVWMHELQKQTKPKSDWLERDIFDSEENHYIPYEDLDPPSCEDRQPRYMSHIAFPLESTASQVTSDSEPERHPHENHEIEFIDKSVSDEEPTSNTGNESLVDPSFKLPVENYDEHEDDWLDDDSELEGYTGMAITLVNGEDVSFSDLEDDLDCTIPTKSKVVTKD